MKVFENPSNGHRERVSGWSILWAALFGFLYFAVKGVWTHAAVLLVLVVVTGYATAGLGAILVTLVYAAFAPKILATDYLRRGWRQVS